MNYYNMPSLMMGNMTMDRVNEEYANVKELYPYRVQLLSRYVEEEMDRYDYFGSFIYDEYPDKVTIYGMIKRIYERQLTEKSFPENTEKDLLMMIIEILIYNELFSRRQKKRYWRFMG